VSTVEQIVAKETPVEEERRTSFLELFFDLVFVFSITQVTALILEDTSAAGFLRSALVLWLVWWAWGAFAWMTNAIDISSVGVRLAFLAGMAGSFFMALAVPDAYQDEGVWFAIPYFAVRVLHVALYTYGLRTDPAHQAAIKKLAPWFLVAPAFVLVGGFLEGDARVALWATCVAIDIAGALNVSGAGFRVSPGHFSERYALFVIIALGESIVAVGIGSREADRDALFAGTVVLAFAGVAALWWAYFEFVALGLERVLRHEPVERRGPLARDLFSFFHYPIVLGIIFLAVAGEEALAHPHDPLPGSGRVALGAGAAVFLLGFVLIRYRALRLVAWERAFAAVAAVIAVAVLRDLSATAVLAVVLGLILAMLAVEAARLREIRDRLHVEEA
jgi:low temperature requirement protein LtrA